MAENEVQVMRRSVEVDIEYRKPYVSLRFTEHQLEDGIGIILPPPRVVSRSRHPKLSADEATFD